MQMAANFLIQQNRSYHRNPIYFCILGLVWRNVYGWFIFFFVRKDPITKISFNLISFDHFHEMWTNIHSLISRKRSYHENFIQFCMPKSFLGEVQTDINSLSCPKEWSYHENFTQFGTSDDMWRSCCLLLSESNDLTIYFCSLMTKSG